MAKKVGLLGGTFDPVHNGHLQLAYDLMHLQGLSEIWFCPAKQNPHKKEKSHASAEERLAMIKRAIEEEPSFKLITHEINRSGPSYAIDTIRSLLKEEKEVEFFLILTDETIERFREWKDVEEIVAKVPLLIGTRKYASLQNVVAGPEDAISRAIRQGWCPTTPLKVSSTELRRKLAKGEDCSAWVPKKVLDFIVQNNLYS